MFNQSVMLCTYMSLFNNVAMTAVLIILIGFLFAAWCYAIMRCPYVCPSVTFVDSV